jgi:glycogen(starch) synthase
MRAEVVRLFAPDAPIAVVPNGIVPRRWAVDAEQVATVRRRWAPGGEPLLVNLGRLEYEKGVQDLLAALPRIRERCARTRLLVVGTGTQAAMLEEVARGYGVDGAVTFAGHVPDDDLAATLAAADAVVLPSRYEPFGIVALEVAAAGAPLVAARTGGLAEVVGDDAGLSFPPGDVDALVDAVVRTLGDADAAAGRVARARTRLTTDFDWARIAARTAEVLRAAQRRPPVALGRPTIASGDLLGAPER